MNLLFDITHPAHFHLFKNFMLYLKEKGHKVIITSRKKDVLESLLDHYDFDYYSLSSPAKGSIGMLKELWKRNKKIFELHKKYKFDASFGTSVSIGFLKLKYGVPAYNFNEDDDEVVKKYIWLAYPLATKIINPDCLKFKKWKKKRILYPSFHEMAYLHPDNFKPNIKIVEKHGLEDSNYVIIRISALNAHHDDGIKGISNDLLTQIKSSLAGFIVIESQELKKKYQIQPWDMHHVLAFAKMIICDSQTMAAEAMVLGTPSIRINSFVGKISYLEELENKYNLGYGIKPENNLLSLKKIKYLLNKVELNEDWRKKRNQMLNKKIDLNNWVINFFENEINK